jgi:FdhE protein
MTEAAIKRLEELGRNDPTAAPLARLQAEALRAAADPAWGEGLPEFSRERLADGIPLLHGAVLPVDSGRVKELLERLASLADRSGAEGARAVQRALGRQAFDPLALLEAAIAQESERLAVIAQHAALDLGVLATLAHVATLPLLQACGRRAAPLLGGVPWDSGCCPVCAAWPTLAELRGLERKRWLRCGRCGAGWTFPDYACVFCANTDFRTQGYLAPEAEREARRAVTCDRCRGYLKTFATIRPVPPAEIGVQDLATLELDVAALEHDYVRPEARGFPLELRLSAAPRRSGLFGWRG